VLPVEVPGASFELHDPAASVALASHQCLIAHPPTAFHALISEMNTRMTQEMGNHTFGDVRGQLLAGSFAPMRALVTRRPWLGLSAGSVRAAG